jgi:hypothetical protein
MIKVLAIVLTMFGYGEAAIAAQSNPYDETKACIDARADMIDVYLSKLFPPPDFQVDTYKSISEPQIIIPASASKGDQFHATYKP